MESFSLLFLQEVSRAEDIDVWAAADADVQGITPFLNTSLFIYLHICGRGRACCMQAIDWQVWSTNQRCCSLPVCPASCLFLPHVWLQTTRSSARGCVSMPLLLSLTLLNLLENLFLTPSSKASALRPASGPGMCWELEKNLIPNPSELLST